jgi:hypothetical protein
MEGIFNLLLAWSVLFSGFLVDGRKKVRSTSQNERMACYHHVPICG